MRTDDLLSVSTMISEPLRFNHRDRQSTAIRRTSLFHLLVRLRSLANDPRFQPARSVSRPMLRDVDKDLSQYFRKDRSADASQHPRRRNDVPRSGVADVSRLLFRDERRRRRQTPNKIVAEHRPPHFPLHVVRRLAADDIQRQGAFQRADVRLAVPTHVVQISDFVPGVLLFVEQCRDDFKDLPLAFRVFDTVTNDTDLHRLLEIVFGITVRNLRLGRSLPRHDEVALFEPLRGTMVDETTAAHPHDDVDAAFFQQRDGRERAIQGVHDDDVARMEDVELRTQHRNLAGPLAGVIVVNEIENAAGRHRQDGDRARERHPDVGMLVRMTLEFREIFRRAGQRESRSVDDPGRSSEGLPVFRGLLVQFPCDMSCHVGIDIVRNLVPGADIASGIDAGRLDADFVAISDGSGDGGVAGLVGEELPENHPDRQGRRVDGVVRFAESASVFIENALNEFAGQDVVAGSIVVLIKGVEKRRRGEMGKSPSFFGEESCMLDIQKALLGLLSRIAVQRGRRRIVQRGLSVKAGWEINKKYRSCQWRFYAL